MGTFTGLLNISIVLGLCSLPFMAVIYTALHFAHAYYPRKDIAYAIKFVTGYIIIVLFVTMFTFLHQILDKVYSSGIIPTY